MTKLELNNLIARYIIAIGKKGGPNSHVWLMVDPRMSDVARHQIIVATLVDAGLVQQSNYFLTLTEKGLAMHEKLVKMLTEVKPASQPVGGSEEVKI